MTSVLEESCSDGAGAGAEPLIVVLYCQQSVAAGITPAVRPSGAEGFSVRLKMMPCSSKAEAPHLLHVLAGGASGVELVCCPERACQFLDGNDRAARRVEHARGLLEEINVSPERLGLSRGAGLTEEDLMIRAKNRADAISALDSNLTEKVK
ncbi:MAG: hydrogenase iron-sulfur subunit [Phycisphaerae bacterium]|jgi:coenzyme F420-reducing hydrogenase delta subunit|nr:hydrogenase iron-sulfur subunit [Phycisphaerae bacterium]